MPKNKRSADINLRRMGAGSGTPLGITATTPTTSGPLGGVDIYVSGRSVNRKGNTILVYNGDAQPLTEYAATSAGLTAALAAAGDGDVVWLAPGDYTAVYSVPAGVGVVSMDNRTRIMGPVTLGVNSYLRGVTIEYTAESAGTIAALTGPATGAAIINDGHVKATNTGTGDACGILMSGGDLLVWSIFAEGIASGGGDGYGIYAGAGTCTVQAGYTYGTSGAILGDNIERTTLDGLVQIHSAGGAVMGVFAPTSAGIDLALAAAVDGDVVQVPAGTMPGDHTIGAGVEVVGRGRENTVLSGQITLGDGAMLRNLSVARTASNSGELVAVLGPASGTAYVFNCTLSALQAGSTSNVGTYSGHGYAIKEQTGGSVVHAYCDLQGQASGIDCNPLFDEAGSFGVNAEVDTGAFDVDAEAGLTISGLTVGWYALENTGGPWTNGDGDSLYSWAVSFDGGTTWEVVESHIAGEARSVFRPSGCEYVETVGADHARMYFAAQATSLKARVGDGAGAFLDNGGSMGYTLSTATVTLGATSGLASHIPNLIGRMVCVALPSDRAAWNVADYGEYHADDWAAGDSHHAAVTLDADADTLLSLTGQELGLDTQAANTFFRGPTSGAAAVPTFGALVADDMPVHASTHENGGADEISVAGLSGVLADEQTPVDHDHSGDAGDGGTFDAANLTSGAATDGQVLTADGAAGAAWEDPSGGAAGDLTTRYEPLTNGDGASPELLFTADGDCIMVEVSN